MTDNPPYAILMNGYTASLKTYTARRISNVLKIPIIETNRLGSCTSDDGLLNDDMRQRRYDIAIAQASLLAEKGLPVVIDGTFNFQKWRNGLYLPLAENDISNVVIVRCLCEDLDIIRARVEERKERKILPENEAAKMENYFKTRGDDQSIYEDELPSGVRPSIVEFRTGPEYTAEVRQGDSDIARVVREIIWRSFHTGRLNEH